MAVETVRPGERQLLTATPTEPPGLAVRVRKAYAQNGDAPFILDAEFSVPSGITILCGPSGSGKTTALQCIAGLLTPDSGYIQVGQTVLFDSQHRVDVSISRRKIGYVFQTLALFPHMSVGDNIAYGIAHLDARTRRERVQAIADSFNIARLLQRRPGEISGGERQRTALARALVGEPCVLLLDEPLSALDAPRKSQIMDDLREWNSAHRIPVLYVTHARNEVFALGERVIFLEEGRVLAQGTPQDVLEAPRHETVAQFAGFENIFDATVTLLSETQGIMTCRLGESDVEIEVPLAARALPGTRLRAGIRAGDILLANAPPQGLSARNVLAGRIVRLARDGVMVVAVVDCGVPFQVSLTPSARTDLRLDTGSNVWLVMKTYSWHLLRPGND